VNRLESLFKALESPEFAALVNRASDWKTFARILGSEKAARDLAGEMSDAEVRGAVCARMLALVANPGEEGADHPWDSALAAYLWLLANKDAPLARSAAATVAEAPRCWWARKVADRVLSPREDRPPPRERSTRPRRLAAAVVLLAVGVAAGSLLWKGPFGGLRRSTPAHEEQAAKEDYGRKLAELAELRRRSERVEADLFADEKAADDEVERRQREVNDTPATRPEARQVARQLLEAAREAHRIAAELVELWRKHPLKST
jgi:hypothetical protein